MAFRRTLNFHENNKKTTPLSLTGKFLRSIHGVYSVKKSYLITASPNYRSPNVSVPQEKIDFHEKKTYIVPVKSRIRL